MTRECHWCGRNEWIDSIVDDLGDTYYWCHRHEDEVKSMIVDFTDEESE